MSLFAYTKYNPPLTPREWQYLRDRKKDAMHRLNAEDAAELEMDPSILLTLPEWFRCQERIAWQRGGRVGPFRPKPYPAKPQAVPDKRAA